MNERLVRAFAIYLWLLIGFFALGYLGVINIEPFLTDAREHSGPGNGALYFLYAKAVLIIVGACIYAVWRAFRL